jgi:type I restriction enzyme R subunit
LKIIDFENFENNTFNCVTELEFEKGLDAFRPDITLLINGLPLVFIEVKKPNNKEGIIAERNRINTRLANKNFKKIINLTQFMIFSNNMEYDTENLTPIQGAFYATTSRKKAAFNCFREEKLDFKDIQILSGEVNEDFILTDTNLRGVLVDAVCPNHSRTDMGGPDAPRSAEEGAATALWLATREFNAGDTTGVLWEDNQIVQW